jgi:hypothetical protein
VEIVNFPEMVEELKVSAPKADMLKT